MFNGISVARSTDGKGVGAGVGRSLDLLVEFFFLDFRRLPRLALLLDVFFDLLSDLLFDDPLFFLPFDSRISVLFPMKASTLAATGAAVGGRSLWRMRARRDASAMESSR